MEYRKALEKHIDNVFNIVQNTVTTVYPKYYPKEVVDFFCQLHSRENITKDIKNGNVGVLVVDNRIVGTGSREDNHITRVYVLPEFQGKGYGSFIMQCLENTISEQYNTVMLDASLPASHLYEQRGYRTIKHEKWNVEHGVVLVYEVMEKTLCRSITDICYEGKRFCPKVNTSNGEVNGETIFCYHQRGNEFWAEYSGGEISRGYMIGFVEQNGALDFYYHHINTQNNIRVGKCHSIPRLLDNGKIELAEEWQWLNGDMSKGSSIVTEL